MVSRSLFLVFALVAASLISTSASAKCYKKIAGGACIKSDFGNLDSTCTNPCAISRAPEIEAVQNALSAKGYNPGPVDGIMGPKTRRALVLFQKDNNLQQTDKLSQQSLDELGVTK